MSIDYKPQLERLAQVFNDNTEGVKIIPTKPDDPQQAISLPPSNMKNFYKQTTAEEVVAERKAVLAASDNQASDLTKENQPQPLIEAQHLPQATTELPSLTKEQTQQNIDQQELPRVVVEQEQNIQQEQQVSTSEKLSQPTRGRGRPKGSKNKPKTEKVSQRVASSLIGAKKVSHNEKVSRTKKVSQAQAEAEYLPVNLHFPSQTGVKGKTSLCYALLYARELTPLQIETLLHNQADLNLTSAEVIALSLIDRTTKGDQKAEKIYWDLLKNQAKNEKITPEKAENTLLDEALVKAENAIFGEIVVDTEK